MSHSDTNISRLYARIKHLEARLDEALALASSYRKKHEECQHQKKRMLLMANGLMDSAHDMGRLMKKAKS